MKRNVLLLTAFVALSLGSCQRRPLDEACETTSKIPIGTLWEKSEVKAQNVTAYFYDQESGKLVSEYRFENIPQTIQSYVSVPFGKYTVVVHNEIREQIKNVSVRGFDNLSTLEFFTQDDATAKTRAEGDTYIKQPDPVAAAIVRNVSIEPAKDNNQLIGIETEQKNSYMYITVHIKGLNNARMPALVDLRNIASSYFVNTDQPSKVPSTVQFTMNNRTYDEGSQTDGTISSTVALHGTLGDRLSVSGHKEKPIYLDMLFMLIDADKTVIRRTVDITSIISFTKMNNGSVHLLLNLNLEDSLPEVIPEGSEDSGFGSDLEDWDWVDVPLEL